MPEARHYNASWIIGGFLCKKNTNRHCEVGFSVGWSKANPQVGAGRYSGDNPNNPTFATKQSIDRGQALPSAMTCDWQDTQKTVIAHSVARSLSLDCFAYARNDGNKRFFGFHPQDDRREKAAFTLAEVLITLGIIGIIAAMTLPQLIAKYQKLVTVTQLKRTYSLLSNAYQMAVNDYGDSIYWDYPITDENNQRSITNDEFLERYYLPYLQHQKKKSGLYKAYNFNGQDIQYDNVHGRGSSFRMSDGSCLTLWSNNQYVVLTTDLNCEKGPNIYGRDIFDIFELYYMNNKKPFIAGLDAFKSFPREQIMNNSGCKTHTYNGGKQAACFAIIVYDGWQIKDDYPWK